MVIGWYLMVLDGIEWDWMGLNGIEQNYVSILLNCSYLYYRLVNGFIRLINHESNNESIVNGCK